MSDSPGDGPAGDPHAPVHVDLDGEPFTGAALRIAGELAAETVASRLAEADPSVWGPPATHCLGWVHLPRTSRPLVGQVRALREKFVSSGAHRVLLVGGAAATAGARALAEPSAARLTVLDGADPAQVADALAGELSATVLVVADAAGDDPVVAAVHRVVADAIAEELADGIDAADPLPDDPLARAALAERTVYLTEPGSPLDERARAEGSVVVTVDADVPERFSALGPFGLVPAGLAGTDVESLLSGAAAAAPLLTADAPDNPALVLAGALVAARGSLLALRGADDAPAQAGWIAQMVSGAHGPLVVVTDDDTGLVPPRNPAPSQAPAVVEVFAGRSGFADDAGVATSGDPGAGVLLWQGAVAVAARRLGSDPFAPAPVPARDPGEVPPAFVDGGVEVHAGDWLSAPVDTVGGALAELVALTPERGHVAVAAWLDPETDASVAVLRGVLAERTGLPTTFGWAPRSWSGEGRRHLDPGDDVSSGVHCHLTGGPPDDMPVPADAPGLTELDSLHAAQARSVVAALGENGQPVLRLHLTDRVAGLVTLARAIQDLAPGPDGPRRSSRDERNR
ncbi:MAG: glucose-6-phosphate isomerase [Pseudonocardia sp.]|nr:glucose-6-phosphate isomerase [Pseudonocardia sp.]